MHFLVSSPKHFPWFLSRFPCVPLCISISATGTLSRAFCHPFPRFLFMQSLVGSPSGPRWFSGLLRSPCIWCGFFNAFTCPGISSRISRGFPIHFPLGFPCIPSEFPCDPLAFCHSSPVYFCMRKAIFSLWVPHSQCIPLHSLCFPPCENSDFRG